MLSNTQIEEIRVKYATGMWHKRDLWLSMRDKVSHVEFGNILDSSEIREDLSLRIKEIPIAQELFKEYQDAIRKEADRSQLAERQGRPYPYEENVLMYREVLDSKLLELTTITFEELRKFYVPDLGLC